MKKSILALCALTVAAGLSACGGGTSSYAIGGTVTGLQYGPLVLVTNGMEVSIDAEPGANSTTVKNYTFPKELKYGEAYNVTLKTIGTDANGNPIYQQPPHQLCGPSGVPGTSTSDVAGRLSVVNAAFACTLASHSIGGTVKGLGAGKLVLTNGSTGGTVTVTKNADGTSPEPIPFTFPAQVTFDQTYGVTVLEQPDRQTCQVANGVGKMEDSDIKTIAVTCTDNP